PFVVGRARENEHDEVQKWFLSHVFIPGLFVLVGVLWANQDLIRTLATGDLLLVGMLLSASVCGEIIFTPKEMPKKLLGSCFFFCLVFIVAYLWVKTQVVKYDASGPGPLPTDMYVCAVVSVLGGAAAIVWSILSYMLF